MKNLIFLIVFFGLIRPAYAQDVVTAESEDLQMFDQAIKSKLSVGKSKAVNDKSPFGDFVSQEAKKLKDTNPQTKLGERVSSEAQKNNNEFRGGSERADRVRGNSPERGNKGPGNK